MPTEMRLLGGADRPALDRYLKGQPAGMALRGCLARDGVTPTYGVYAGAVENGEVVSVLGLLGGTAYLVAPKGLEKLLALAGRGLRREIHGINGPTAQVERALAWLDAGDARTLVYSRDELFVLRLQDLREPVALRGGGLRRRLATAEDATLQAAWRHDFWVENMGAPPGPKLLEQVAKMVDDEIAHRVLHLLEDGGQPVSTAAFAPELADSVQVANVFTPPALRGRKYAQSVTAAALLDARARGAELGVLYTGKQNAPAQRAYRALGFQPCGDVTMLVFAEPRIAVPGG